MRWKKILAQRMLLEPMFRQEDVGLCDTISPALTKTSPLVETLTPAFPVQQFRKFLLSFISVRTTDHTCVMYIPCGCKLVNCMPFSHKCVLEPSLVFR